MKNLLLTLFIAISINSFGQNWTDFHVDSMLTLKLPDNYKIRHTLGIKVISAEIKNAMISVSMIQNTGEKALRFEDGKKLLEGYDGFKNGYISSRHGKLIKEQIIKKCGLKMLRFSFHAEVNGEQQIWHSIAAFVNDKIYVVSFAELESLSKEMTETREMVFSSITFPPGLGLNNQLGEKSSYDRAYNVGVLIGEVIGVMIMGFPIVLIVWLIIRWVKKRVNTQPL